MAIDACCNRWKERLGVLILCLVGLLLPACQVLAAGSLQRSNVVEVSATAMTLPPAVLLSWPLPEARAYTVYRRGMGTTNWGSGTNIGIVGTYTDTTVSVGATYEYKVDRNTGDPGYLCAGVEAPMVESRGKVVLLVDSNVMASVSNEITRLQADLAGDGWIVLRHDVPRDMAVTNVKAIIKADYDADPVNVKSLFILGHVPVPYSGNLSPDGHGHRAYPTDQYYAELYGTTWTDSTVLSTNFTDSDVFPYRENWNIPGDGKFDQSTLDSPPELELGRVDVYNMPGFPLNEVALLRQYLNKDHAFRHGQMPVRRAGLVYDSWGFTSAREAWRNFAPCCVASNVVAADWWSMESQSFLWAYSCGYGDWQSGDSANFSKKVFSTPFTMRFGSWSGDWNDPDNVLRRILCSAPNGLTCSWAGGDFTGFYWHYYPMAFGYTAGYCAKLSQDRQGPYSKYVWGELMGDPTLRMHPVVPPTNLTASVYSGGIALHWGPAPGPVRGYAVYRGPSSAGPFVRLKERVANCDYYDNDPAAGPCVYMVRAVALETSGSGTYLNPSQGIFVSATGNGTPPATAPAGLAATDGTLTDRVRLSWNPVISATAGYAVWRAPSNDTGLAVCVGISMDAAWDDVTLWEGVTHFYWVTARNGAGDSGFSNGDSGFQGFAAAQPPTGLDASDGFDTNRVMITWNALPRQTATYEVWRNATNDPAGAVKIAGLLSDTVCTDAPPVAGVAYYYWVRSIKEGGTGDFGIPVSGSAQMPAPGGITATDGSYADRIEISWDPVPYADGYEVWHNLETTNFAYASRFAVVAGTSCVDTAIHNHPLYYWVRATNSLGVGVFNDTPESGFVKPAAPGQVWASDGLYTNRVQVEWSYSMAATGVDVWRSTNSTLADAARIATLPYYIASYSDTSAAVGVTYFYWIHGTNSVPGDFSVPESGYRAATVSTNPPTTPAWISASDGVYSNAILVSWAASSNAAVYELYNEWFEPIADVFGTNYLDASVPPNTVKSYCVVAINDFGYSTETDFDQGNTIMRCPTGVKASDGIYSNQVRLTWVRGGWESVNTIWRSLTNDPATASQVGIVSSSTNYTDTNVMAGLLYYYWVRGSGDASSDFSSADNGYSTLALPPTGVAASDGVSTSMVRIAWNPSAGADSYTVWRSTVYDPASAALLAAVSGTNADDSGVEAGQVYWYWVRSVAGGMTSGVSVADSGFICPVALSSPPATVSASDGTLAGTVRVEWSAVDAPALYQVWRNTVNDSGGVAWLGTTSATRWDDAGVASDGVYYYWVAVSNVAGVGPLSPGDSGYSRLPAPADLAASRATLTNRITVEWAMVPGALMYDVWRGALDTEEGAMMIATVSSNRYDDTTAADRSPWYYRIKARNALTTSAFSASITGERAVSEVPGIPASLSASDGIYTGMVRVTWAPAALATGYQVWRGASSNVTSAARLGVTASTSYDDIGAPDTFLWYWVTATNVAGESALSSGDLGWPIWPNGTNALPFAESFEAYPPGFMLPGTHGWYAAYRDSAVVSDNAAVLAAEAAYHGACGFPLPATRSRVMQLFDPVSVALDCPSNTAIWCDMMVSFKLTDGTVERQVPGASEQLALYASTNGHLVLWHRLLPQRTNTWTQLDRTVETGRWYRLTVVMDYATVDPLYSSRYFQMDLDGVTVSNALAFTLNNGSGATGGTWFAAASDAPLLRRLKMAGEGYVDDLVIGTRNPHHRLAPRGTPDWWLQQYGLTNMAAAIMEEEDRDNDGQSAWAEFVAGTDPTNPASVFRFTALPGMTGSVQPVSFSSVPGRRYRVFVATNLVGGGWSEGLLSGSANGPFMPGPYAATNDTTQLYIQPGTPQQFYKGSVER
jgi:hypothetical protein